MRLISISICLITIISGGVMAQQLPSNCLQSFSVKNKSVTYAGHTMQCVALEKYRAKLFTQYNGFIVGASFDVLKREISRLDSALTKAERDKNWASLMSGFAFAGNIGAIYGLKACIPTAGAGCAWAAFSAIAAKLAILDAAPSLQKQIDASKFIRTELAKARKTLEDNQNRITDAKKQMSIEFKAVCDLVQAKCL